MVIERKTVLKALRTEPLARGYFFEVESKDNKACKVCAVGSIVRQHLSKQILKTKGLDELSTYCEFLTDHSYDSTIDENQQKEMIAKGNYLGALSAFFERQGSVKRVTQKQREQLVQYVKKNFPVRFKVKTLKEVEKISK